MYGSIYIDFSGRPPFEKIKPFNYDWLIQEKEYLMNLPVSDKIILMLKLNKSRTDNLLSRLGYK